jgi:hypothetical protein
MKATACMMYEIMAPKTAMFSRLPPMTAAPFSAPQVEPESEHDRQCQCRTGHHGQVGCLAPAMGDGKHCREIPRTTERVNLPALGKNDGVKTGDETKHGYRRQCLGDAFAIDGLEAVQQGFPGGGQLVEPTPATDGLSQRIMNAETISVKMPARIPRGMSRAGSMDSSAANGKLLDRKEQPDSEGQAGQNTYETLGQKGPMALDQDCAVGAHVHGPEGEVDGG